MCYNIAYIEQRGERYEKHYRDLNIQLDFDFLIEVPVSYFLSGFTHPKLPVITSKGFEISTWGLIPFWVKDIQQAKELRKRTLNAVGETVFEKPSYRSAIIKKRCLLPVSGFYEWREFNNAKYPYFIKVSGEDIFSLGGICDQWVDKSTGEIINSFSIVTTPANPLMEKISNLKKRMPLILPREDEAKWIDSDLNKEEIGTLIKPFDEDLMVAYTISNDANSPRRNRNIPEILTPVEYAELD